MYSTYPPTPEIYTLSLRGALPILRTDAVLSRSRTTSRPSASTHSVRRGPSMQTQTVDRRGGGTSAISFAPPWLMSISVAGDRPEEHTSELQSQSNLVCRLRPEKKT